MIEVEYNDAQVTAALAALFDAISSPVEAMQDIGEFMVKSTKERFPEGAAPDGTPWAPNSPVTLARKKDTRPLFGESGRLSSQIFYAADQTGVEWGSPAIQAAVMQFGAAQGAFGAFIGKDKLGRDHFHHLPWGDIPARPFLGVSDQDKTDILDIVHEALARALGGG